MKLTKQVEAEVLDVYEAYWGSLFNVDMETYAAVLDKDFKLIGTTEAEVFFKKIEAIRFLKATADQLAGNIELRNRKIKIEPVDELILVTEQSNAYVNIDNVWTFYAKVRASALLQKKGKEWKFIQMHISLPDTMAEEGETIALAQVKKENVQLRDAVKRRTIELENKSRELEIEASLERVRTVTMGMNTPSDILGICKIFFTELQKLGFKDLRNALINFWDDKNGQLHDYDYSDFSGGNFAKLAYGSHPAFAAFQKKIRKAKDAFAKLVIEKDGLKSWQQRRRSSGEYKDPRLNKISALYYYFYSTGVGALGISTFSPISKEEVEVLKKFRNVFDMAYQRYVDIQKSEAQAKEVQIELALERVRARTMAMQHSEELAETVTVMFEQFKALGEEPERMAIEIVNEKENVFEIWATQHGGAQLNSLIKISLDEPHVMKKMYKAWKTKTKSITIDLQGNELEEYFQFLKIAGLPVKRKIFGKRRVQNVATFSKGILTIITPEPRPQETIQLLERFAVVFDGTYTRFLDLQKAEAQAREAQIELGLERVRARAMAMQNSDELKELIGTVFTELTKLDLVLTRCLIMIYDTQSNASTWWMANSEAPTEPIGLFVKNHKLPPYAAYIKAWKDRKNKWQYILEGKDKDNWDDFLFTETELSQLPDFVIAGMKAPDRVCLSASFNNFGCLNLATLEPLSDEHFDILLRFAKVFDLTYTRFNDLQKTEAQVRESQIQLALERVRARTMAMQKSNELAEAAQLLYEEFGTLNINTFLCGYCFYKEEQDIQTIWVTLPDGTIIPDFVDFPITGDLFLNKRYEDWKQKKPLHVLEIQGEANKEHHRFLASKVSDPAVNEIFAQVPERIIVYCANFSIGYLFIITTEFLTGEEENVIIRFGKVFDQTYTRFLDLQKAEAQAREAEIELALERVRAAAMAMRDSAEIGEIIYRLYVELTKLDAKLDRCFIMIVNPENHGITWWMSGKEGLLAENGFFIQKNQHPTHLMYLDCWQKRTKKWQYLFEGKEKRDWDRFGFSKTELAKLPEFVKDYMTSVKKIHLSGSSDQFGSLVTGSSEPLPDEQQNIISRFTVAFNQTYTRFLDLQKAEAQAREAQIEASLERVRSRSMAMHKSDELLEAGEILFLEMQKLGIESLTAGYVLIDKEEKNGLNYTPHPGTKKIMPVPVIIPHNETSQMHQVVENWKKGNSSFIVEMNEEETIQHQTFIAERSTNFPLTAEQLIAISPTRLFLHNFYFKEGYILIVGGTKLSEEQTDIMLRFAKVFQQTYTRFLDLQKAEAQTREAQIEVAVERVRAKALAMHKSDELHGVVVTLKKELMGLHIPGVMAVTLYLEHDENHIRIVDLSDSGDKGDDPTHMKLNKIFNHQDIDQDLWVWKIWNDNRNYFVIENNEEDFKRVVRWLYKIDEQEARIAEKIIIENSITKAWLPTVKLLKGKLNIDLLQPPTAEIESILSKIGAAFDLAYKRFLDLQKAEAQAKESQIQLALERVRARTMAMQQSNELPDAATILFQQVQSLGMPAWSAGYCTWDDDKKSSVTLWMSSEGVLQPPFTAPTTEDELFIEMRKGQEDGKAFHVVEMGGKKLEKHYKYMRSLPVVGEILDSIIEAGHPLPTFQIMHHAYFSKGFLLFITYEPVPDAHDIFKRFGKVFDQTYTRFLDLQKAEAQARESQIQLALERVRARMMAMQKSEELKDVARDLRVQLALLGTNELETCAINLYEENQDSVEAWVAVRPPHSPKEIVEFHFNLPKKGIYIIEDMLGAYASGVEEFRFELAGERGVQWMNTMSVLVPDMFAAAAATPDFKETGSVQAWFSCHYFSGGALIMITMTPPLEESLLLLKKCAQVFGLAYRRFADLKKAEAQAREAKIEAALERVRSRSMAMQKSDELKDVIKIVYQQLRHLEINLDHAGFVVDYSPGGDWHFWIADEQDIPSKISHPYFESVWANQFNEAKEKGIDFFATHLSFEEKNKFYKELLSYVPGLPEASKDFYLNCPGLAASTVLLENVGLYIENFLGTPYTEEENTTLMRFGRAFQQTYTRFLDLQKAEAQAREAQIETALEKVRSRSLAMHNSDELKDVIRVLFEKLKELGFYFDGSGIQLFTEGSKDTILWIASPDFLSAPSLINLPYSEDDFKKSELIRDVWKTKAEGGSVFNKTYSYTEKNIYFDYVGRHNDYIKMPAFVREMQLQAPSYTASIVMEKYSALWVDSWTGKTISVEEFNVLKRISRVFEQSYIRFLDLQKAEAQAREAQIEAALERVRSRSMAMHKSEELADLSLELVKQVQVLGVRTWFCAFNINDDDSQGSLEWGSNGEGTFPKYRTPREGIFLRYYEAGQRGETLFVNEIGENECPAHYEYLCTLPGVGEQLLAMKAAGIPFPSFQIDHVAFFKYGYVLFITYEPVPDAHDIFKRFAKVFEQTYTRFLDLQNAEAQARESQIQLALERVRARTMAMHKSDELPETSHILFEQMKELGEPVEQLTIGIVNEENKVVEISATLLGDTLKKIYNHSIDEPYMMAKVYKAWKQQQKTLVVELRGDELNAYNQFRNELTNSNMFPTNLGKEQQRIVYAAFFSKGMLALGANEKRPPESMHLLAKFASVFDLTYTRFLDLQKAEAQAKEAQIETALEKVRSRTMAMQSSNELQETAAVLFNEFKKLGTEDIYQVTIGIYNEEEGLIDFRVTSWDGSGIQENRSFNLDMNEPTVLQPAVSAWKANKKSLVIDLSGEALEGWLNYRNKMSGVNVSSTDTAGRRVITAAYYSKGHLSISTPVPVPAETIRILERFAAVFDATYTRFLDLQKAEAQAKESKIEAALERVRSRTLAMQKSDELAETAAEVFRQLILLGIEPNRLYIGIVKEETGDMEMWATDEDGTQVGKKFTFNKNENASVLKLYDGWKAKKKSVIVDMQGKELEDYFHYLNHVMHIPFKGGLTQKRRVQSVAYFSKGFIGMASPDGQGEDSIQLLERFAAVFNLTFTRFNDLKIAEAHAQQAEQDLIAIKEAKQKAEEALTELQSTQKQLIQSEKMASLGELTAGIAHEIQNPLNFVNNFSEVSKELLDEMKEAIEKGDAEEAKEIMNDVIQNLEKINHHGKRADGIVKGMLQHSRSSSNQKEPTDINALADEYLRLAYHGLRAKDKSFNATLKTDYDENLGKVSIIPQDMGRVILNLITNAFYVVAEKKKDNIEGYEPTVSVSTKKEGNNILISVRDNGNGIPPKVLDKIFQPFFTTKPTGQGTGLGLSLAYDIVKAHGGEIKVETKENEGTGFIIIL